MLYYLVTALHVLVCIILILVVLLQSGKGADLAGAFGGASTQTAFGSRGPASFLSKLTTISAVIFMVTCLSLTILGGSQSQKSILDSTPGAAAPAKAPAVQPQAPAPTPEQIKQMQQEAEAKAKKQPAEAPPKQPQTPPPAPKKP